MTEMTCPCGATGGLRLYAGGWRCPRHTPAAIAGQPEPGQDRYCAPARCSCGSCPSWTEHPAYVDQLQRNVIDARAVASGKRRASPTAYRNAQAQIRHLPERNP